MAAADNADGSVWNERNRLFADKLFKKDHYAFCDAEFNNGGSPLQWGRCKVAADTFYVFVRVPFRLFNTDVERNSVDASHADYYNGIQLMRASDCSHTANPSNRCLLINYVQYEGKPFSPEKIALVPTDIALEMQVVRANQQSIGGVPPTVIPHPRDPHRMKKTGELRGETVAPFVVGKTTDFGCANASAQLLPMPILERCRLRPPTHPSSGRPSTSRRAPLRLRTRKTLRR